MATLLGFAGYYPTFILQYSALTNWLNRIKMAKKFLWNEEIEQDFIKLKKAFTEGGIQAFPDFGVGDAFILTPDWIKENMEGVLSQVQDGQERFLGCWRRKCNKYERNYPSYKSRTVSCDPVYQEMATYVKLSTI